jgi:hypothetical protein
MPRPGPQKRRHMKLGKIAARISLAAVTSVTAFSMWGGVANADTPWADMRPVFSASASGLFDSDECVALDSNDGFYNNNTRVFQWNCNGHNDQQWSAHYYGTTPTGLALYQIINLQSRKCMEVRNANTVSGTVVDQFTCGSGSIDSISNQLWVARHQNNNNASYLLPWSAVRMGSSMCLDVTGADNGDGVLLEQWACNGGENQQFWFLDPSLTIIDLPTS